MLKTSEPRNNSDVEDVPSIQQIVGATSKEHESRQSYLQGPKLHFTTAALCMCLFLENLEIPIVTTALLGITSELGGFSVLIIFSKLSEIFGRKAIILIVVLIVFAVFSGACGAAQTIEQLVSAAVVAVIVILVSIQNGFPFHGRSLHERLNHGRVFSRQSIQRLDCLGTTLLLIATLFLVAALEEAGVDYPWKSAFVITLLTISGLGWIVFLFWERHITLQDKLSNILPPDELSALVNSCGIQT
ncbi:hypothetical protein F4804DRAFT_337957 [Jackrogersella minutella]|nr:hypothetical protein F4804DRAFT_337957 [Jackrogersella minutella]